MTHYCKVIGCMTHLEGEVDYCEQHDYSDNDNLSEVIIKPDSTLTVWDYEQAINSQGACNATGLINSLNDLRDKLWNVARQYGHGTEWVNHHPILQLYAYQLAHLCHGREPIEWEGWHKAYMFCGLVKDGKLWPTYDYTTTTWQ